MQESVEYRGDWWIPGTRHRWSGAMSYQPGRNPVLRAESLKGGLAIPPGLEPEPVLHGLSVTGKPLTLLDAIQTRASHHLPGVGMEATFTVGTALVGAWLPAADEITLDRVHVRLEGLDEWTDVSGFNLKQSAFKRFSLDYEVPDSIEVAVAPPARIALSFGATTKPEGMPPRRILIEQQARLEIRTDGPQPLKQLIELVRQIRNFFMFVTRERVRLLSLKAYPELEPDDAGETRRERREVEILYRTDIEARRDPPEAWRMLVTLAENRNAAESALTHWLRHADLLGPVFDLYLVGLYQPRIFLELQFLSLAHAAESLHSRRLPTWTRPREEHRQRVEAVVNAAPEELREWARRVLMEANRKSFREALSELVDRLPDSIRHAISDPERLCEQVRITRNYLTHWNKNLQAKAARGDELMRLTWALRSLLEALLLIELGYTSEEVGSLLLRNEDYKRDLSFGLRGSV